MIDIYSKIVLTIIAVCLVVVTFRDIQPFPKAEAQSGPVHVIVDQFLFQYGGSAIKVSCDNCR